MNFFLSVEDFNYTTPIFVTALSSNHLQENIGLHKNINSVVRPVMGNIKILVYDLGLSLSERKKVHNLRTHLSKFFLLNTRVIAILLERNLL